MSCQCKRQSELSKALIGDGNKKVPFWQRLCYGLATGYAVYILLEMVDKIK